MCRELDRIGQKIAKNLPEPEFIAKKPPLTTCICVKQERQPLRRSTQTKMLLQAFQDVGQIERRIAQFELPRLNFTEVQNVVHNSAQHIARLFHDFE